MKYVRLFTSGLCMLMCLLFITCANDRQEIKEENQEKFTGQFEEDANLLALLIIDLDRISEFYDDLEEDKLHAEMIQFLDYHEVTNERLMDSLTDVAKKFSVEYKIQDEDVDIDDDVPVDEYHRQIVTQGTQLLDILDKNASKLIAQAKLEEFIDMGRIVSNAVYRQRKALLAMSKE